MIDMHVHTALCKHATGSVEEYVQSAIRRELSVMAFTDHLPLPDGMPGHYAMDFAEIGQYVREVISVASEEVEVLLGVEADWLPDQIDFTRDLLVSYPFDVVLGSVHFLDDWAFDDPALCDRYAAWTPERLWKRYFDELIEAAGSGLFDVMAHPDLVKKFDFRPEKEPLEEYSRVAEALAQAGVAIEVNTAGLRKPCKELYPSRAFLVALKNAGVPATVGSDAHKPEHVGMDIGKAEEVLRSVGYESVLVFRGRIPEEVPL